MDCYLKNIVLKGVQVILRMPIPPRPALGPRVRDEGWIPHPLGKSCPRLSTPLEVMAISLSATCLLGDRRAVEPPTQGRTSKVGSFPNFSGESSSTKKYGAEGWACGGGLFVVGKQ